MEIRRNTQKVLDEGDIILRGFIKGMEKSLENTGSFLESWRDEIILTLCVTGSTVGLILCLFGLFELGGIIVLISMWLIAVAIIWNS